MTDRELLELAAKAAGIELEGDLHCNPGEWVSMYYEGKTYHSWNPLIDDGDALRLAVKLGLSVEIDNCDDETRVSECGCELLLKHMHFDGGAEAATRRAIVRAAATMAK